MRSDNKEKRLTEKEEVEVSDFIVRRKMEAASCNITTTFFLFFRAQFMLENQNDSTMEILQLSLGKFGI